MSLEKPYLDVPGTTIFDAEQSRKGYHLNQFCMSLMKAENRAAFKQNERAYLDNWPMTEAQKQAILKRDWNEMLQLGGNIYFTAKLGATDVVDPSKGDPVEQVKALTGGRGEVRVGNDARAVFRQHAKGDLGVG